MASRGLRILLITDNLAVGGVQKVVVQLARLLTESGVDVGVLARPGALGQDLPPSVQFHPLRGGLRSVWQMRRLSSRYDVFHAHQRGVALLATIATRGTRARVVEHVHNVFLPVSGRLFSFRGDKLVGCGTRISEMLVEDYGRNRNRVATVLNAVEDVSDASSASRTDSTPRVVAIGRLAPQKDPLRAVAVIAAAQGLFPGAFTFAWAGDGPLADQVRSESRRFSADIEWLGQVRDARRLLSNAHALLLTSAWEGLPLVAIEALAAGVPVVAPDVGSCRDVVITGKTGVLYASDATPDEIATAIHDTLASRDTYRASCRAMYESEFSEERFVHQILSVYSSVLRTKDERDSLNPA